MKEIKKAYIVIKLYLAIFLLCNKNTRFNLLPWTHGSHGIISHYNICISHQNRNEPGQNDFRYISLVDKTHSGALSWYVETSLNNFGAFRCSAPPDGEVSWYSFWTSHFILPDFPLPGYLRLSVATVPSRAFTDWRKSRMSQSKYSALWPRTGTSWTSLVETETGYGLDGWGSIPDLGKRFFFSPQHPERLWGSSSLPSNGFRGSFLGDKAAGAWSW
jgi:hypothetical protein